MDAFQALAGKARLRPEILTVQQFQTLEADGQESAWQ